MTTSNHMLSGAIIALTISQPAIALPLAFVSHFVLDALPHYGYPSGIYGEAFQHRLTIVMESVNAIGVPLLIYLIWGEPFWVWLAAGLAISPDLMWLYYHFKYEKHGLVAPIGPLTRLHRKIQWGERRWGILVEMPVFIVLILVASNLT